MGLEGVELILAYEEHFGISITDGEAGNFRTPKDAIELIRALVEYAQRADLVCEDKGTLVQILYGGNRKAELVLAQMETKATRFFPQEKFKIIKDIDDNKFLDLAYESKARFIITGNTNDFTMSNFNGTIIITPKDFWDNFRH